MADTGHSKKGTCKGGKIRGGVEVDRNKGGNGGGADPYGNTRAARRGGEGEPGEVRKGGGERKGNEGVREMGLLEKDDGDRERAGDTTEEVEWDGESLLMFQEITKGRLGSLGIEEGGRRGGERRGFKRKSHRGTYLGERGGRGRKGEEREGIRGGLGAL